MRMKVFARTPAVHRSRAGSANYHPFQGQGAKRVRREIPTLRTMEARQAAAWIDEQLASTGLQAADVMVLARKRAALLPMQDELRRLHIAAQIGEKTDLIECCEVQDVVALLDVLVSPQHDLSLARALKSPLFGMNDEAL